MLDYLDRLPPRSTACRDMFLEYIMGDVPMWSSIQLASATLFIASHEFAQNDRPRLFEISGLAAYPHVDGKAQRAH